MNEMRSKLKINIIVKDWEKKSEESIVTIWPNKLEQSSKGLKNDNTHPNWINWFQFVRVMSKDQYTLKVEAPLKFQK